MASRRLPACLWALAPHLSDTLISDMGKDSYRVVAIDGPAASGKSSVARELIGIAHQTPSQGRWRVIIIEDVVTTGLSTRETIDVATATGASNIVPR